MMFKIIAKNDNNIQRNVYAVNVTDKGITEFLIWYMGRWEWVDSCLYVSPYGE